MSRRVILGAVAAIALAASARAASITSSGYSENFDTLGAAGSALPDGYSSYSIAGAKTDFLVATPVTAAAVASATVGSPQTINLVWNTGDAADARLGGRVSNVGSSTGAADRALGSSPTGNAANVIQLLLTNSTGAPLSSANVSYTHRVLSLGSNNLGEAGELPGFTFFYSTDGTSWTSVPALAKTETALGSFDSGAQTVTFGSPVANGGSVYFRWVDDNNDPASPDAMQGLDNVAVAVPEPASLSVLALGASGLLRRRQSR